MSRVPAIKCEPPTSQEHSRSRTGKTRELGMLYSRLALLRNWSTCEFIVFHVFNLCVICRRVYVHICRCTSLYLKNIETWEQMGNRHRYSADRQSCLPFSISNPWQSESNLIMHRAGRGSVQGTETIIATSTKKLTLVKK